VKLFKYRDLSYPDSDALQRLSNILHRNEFWCARPETLNDPEEFTWQCDYQSTDETAALLEKVLIELRQKSPTEARTMAAAAVSSGLLQELAEPVFKELIDKCRSELGLACFATASTNTVMWERYGGNGAGVCIEVDVPSELLNDHLFLVEYPAVKQLHIDQLLHSFLESSHVRHVYSVALLSKPPFWAPEAEVRFVSQKQDVAVRIAGSNISRLVLGPHLNEYARRGIQTMVASLGYVLPVESRDA
jgi:hypothetical protein